MQTHFSAEQLAVPEIAESERIIRKCVHCGFCLATCPTYLELGSELDSPRGRIYLIKDMLESGRPAGAETALHIDRCLSCLSCATTCPSGVDYMHLIDRARVHVENTYRRPFGDRAIRALLAAVLPYPARFRAALFAARLVRPLAPLLDSFGGPFRKLAAMLKLASPQQRGATPSSPDIAVPRRGRVALLKGCAQSVLDPGINQAAESLLARFGIDVIKPEGEGCCGSLVHHMGREDEARGFARKNIDAWTREIDTGLDAILITTSGCGTLIKDYGHLLADDAEYAAKAALVGSRTLDVSEYLAKLDLPAASKAGIDVAYHAACSLQHGQKVTLEPRALLERAGFTLREIPEGHICCGSAGTYNILHPDIAGSLRDRKLKNIATTHASVIATGNIGCMTQLRSGTATPVVHLVELLDWAYGGAKPEALNRTDMRRTP
ncbi:glycolate oxidase iron-sulfur subunit [Terrihabitans soli]|uniref:Glycolate oxidase iron-sulfur subunit n=1 Tax=Terrihabitans soli TaxID=708113 RepID=A0A6S6QZX7_9HYPH|nr:glycolate oxidase subunit GlcF [Terrihabitans soli]BCJ92258.1 glycolate oxidase iron-sulfur subunit [Terrihabitans soli]